MPTYYRRDEDVTDHMGNPVSGVTVYLCTQPANTNVIPPSPLAPIFSDSTGSPLSLNPPQTDAYGHCEFYAAPGVYTVVYYSTQILGQTMALTDQCISGPTPLPPQYVNDSSSLGTITPLPDGVETEFDLSQIPITNSVVLCLNGVVQTGYTLLPGLLTVVFPTAVPTGTLITAHYQVA